MPHSDKKVVYYLPLDHHLQPIVGRRADVRAFGHPSFVDGQWVQTSAVQKINVDGSFETLNTIYKPQND